MAFTAIEADLEAFSPGRVAAVGHGAALAAIRPTMLRVKSEAEA